MTPEQLAKLKENRVERRFLQTSAEHRVAAVDKKIVGHSAVFNAQYDLGYYIETMKPGAFARTIAEDDIRCLFNHDPSLLLGRNRGSSPSLILREDDAGLPFECEPGDTSVSRDVRTWIDREEITGCSIGFSVTGQEVYQKNDLWFRDITEVKLYDVGPVTFPAYIQTDVSLRFAEQVFAGFRSGPDSRQVQEEIERLAAEKLSAAGRADIEMRRRRLQLLSAL